MPERSLPAAGPGGTAMTTPATLGTDLAPAPGTPPCHDAQDLTRGGATAMIVLNRQHYTLRITRQGKLILTK